MVLSHCRGPKVTRRREERRIVNVNCNYNDNRLNRGDVEELAVTTLRHSDVTRF